MPDMERAREIPLQYLQACSLDEEDEKDVQATTGRLLGSELLVLHNSDTTLGDCHLAPPAHVALEDRNGGLCEPLHGRPTTVVQRQGSLNH
jgi:hypothetical protein